MALGGYSGIQAANVGVTDPRHAALFDNANAKGNVATNVSAMQQFLKNRGYNITVDGIRGPQTNAAVLAFHQHIAPNAFNTRGKAAAAGKATAPAAGAGNNTGKVGRGPAGKGKGSAGTATAADPYALLNPAQYAAGEVNAQYNPQINDLLRQLTQGRSDESSHTQQIQDWYQKALDIASQGATDNAQAGSDAAKSYNDANANVLNLFGGPNASGSTASEAQAFHDIGLGGLTGNTADQAAFDKNLKSVLATQGVEAQTGQFNSDQQNLKDLAAQLLDLRGAKGQAYSSAYQEGVQNRTQQQAAQQQLKLAQEMEPAQVATAQANAATAKANASTAAASAQTNLAIARANLKRANLATTQALSSNGGQWNLNIPQQQGALQKAFETNVMGPRGGLSLNPEVAWANLQQQLQMNGLANDPKAQAIAKGTFLQGLHTSHSLGNFGGWAWNGSKIVRTGNTYKVDKATGKRVLVNKKGKVIADYKPKN